MDDILVGFWKCKGYLRYAVPLYLAVSLPLAWPSGGTIGT